MILHKWNYKTHAYEPYESPAQTLCMYTQDMSLPIDCANCGTHMTFGDGYTSKTIHDEIGFGYPVCEGCYNVEVETKAAYVLAR